MPRNLNCTSDNDTIKQGPATHGITGATSGAQWEHYEKSGQIFF